MNIFLEKKRKKVRKKVKNNDVITKKYINFIMYKDYLNKILLDQHNFLLLKAIPIAIDSPVNVTSYFTMTNFLFCAAVISIVALYLYIPDVSLFNFEQRIYYYAADIDKLSEFALIDFRKHPEFLPDFADSLRILYSNVGPHTLIYKPYPDFEQHVNFMIVQNIESVIQFIPVNVIWHATGNIERVWAYMTNGSYTPGIPSGIITPLCKALNHDPSSLWDYVFFMYAEAPTLALKIADVVQPVLWALLFKIDWTPMFRSKIKIEPQLITTTSFEEIKPLSNVALEVLNVSLDILKKNLIDETENIDSLIEILLLIG